MTATCRNRSAADLVEYFGESADYLMIDNPKNFQAYHGALEGAKSVFKKSHA